MIIRYRSNDNALRQMITSLRKIAPLEFFHKDRTFHPLGNEVTGQRGSVRSVAREGDFVTLSIGKPRTRKENPPFFSRCSKNLRPWSKSENPPFRPAKPSAIEPPLLPRFARKGENLPLWLKMTHCVIFLTRRALCPVALRAP